MLKKVAHSLVLACLVIAKPTYAIDVYFSHNTPPESLICPNDKVAKVSSQPTHIITQDVPPLEEVNRFLAQQTVPESVELEPTPSAQWSNTWKRIAIWGDSHTAAHFFSETLINVMGLDNKRSMPSFISPFVGSSGVRLPLRKVCKSRDWKMEHAYVNRLPEATWSSALTRLRSQQQDAYLWLDFRSQQLENTFQILEIQLAQHINMPENELALVRLSVNGSAEQIVEINTTLESSLKISAESPIATVQLSLVAGNIGIEGFIPHYTVAPEYVFDTFGIPGATARGLQFMMTEASQVSALPSYDLIIASFGTNEGNNPHFNTDNYAQELKKSLTVLRQKYPTATCVLIGPTDRGVLVPHKRLAAKKVCTQQHKKRKCTVSTAPRVDMLRYAKIHQQISDIQAQTGQEFACYTWSWQQQMGGQGGIYRWLYRKPALAQRDLVHLTAQGYRHSAELFARKLSKIAIENNSQASNDAPAIP